jgi:stage V sporulation protein S
VVAVLKVSARSNPNAVAGAFAGVVREHGRAEVCVIGAGALNQAVKAVAIARSYLAPQGIDLVCVPTFCELEIDGERRTGVRLVVEPREPATAPLLAHDDLVVEVRLDDAPVSSPG